MPSVFVKNSFENRIATATVSFFLMALSLAGCGGNSGTSHGGLVADISGEKSPHAGETTSYDFDASSAYDYHLSYAVNWGDGTPPLLKSDVSSGSSISADHAWANPGTYTITATVTDGHGESGINTYSVEVTAAPPADKN